MKDLKTLIEASLLDVEGTIRSGNKYENVDLEMLMNSKSEEEFNLLYDILKSNLASTEKRPIIITRNGGHKYIETKPGEFYIVFYTYKYGGKEWPAIIFGNKDTISAHWEPTRNKISTSWSTIGFAHLHSGMYEYEMRQLPKEWSKQILKLLIRTRR